MPGGKGATSLMVATSSSRSTGRRYGTRGERWVPHASASRLARDLQVRAVRERREVRVDDEGLQVERPVWGHPDLDDRAGRDELDVRRVEVDVDENASGPLCARWDGMNRHGP